MQKNEQAFKEHLDLHFLQAAQFLEFPKEIRIRPSVTRIWRWIGLQPY